MAFRIRWTTPAALDLEKLAVYLEDRTDLLESQRVVRCLLETIESLGEFPRLDAPLDNYPKLRRRVCLGQAVVYEVFEGEGVVEITRVLNQRQSFTKHL